MAWGGRFPVRHKGGPNLGVPPFGWTFRKAEMNKHLWAFYYYFKRAGDRCWVTRSTVVIEREMR